ncbi:hypothetical protein SNEBB_004652 [Seison nebaliae]|nr:hypothetical protein SNEBB_004652 [Seison nebaliae]
MSLPSIGHIAANAQNDLINELSLNRRRNKKKKIGNSSKNKIIKEAKELSKVFSVEYDHEIVIRSSSDDTKIDWDLGKIRGQAIKSPNCNLCYEKFEYSIETLLPCSHSFHLHCMELYERNQLSVEYLKCPLCRQIYLKRLISYENRHKLLLKSIVAFQAMYRGYSNRKETYKNWNQMNYRLEGRTINCLRLKMDMKHRMLKEKKIEQNHQKEISAILNESNQLIREQRNLVNSISQMKTLDWISILRKFKNRFIFHSNTSILCSICHVKINWPNSNKNPIYEEYDNSNHLIVGEIFYKNSIIENFGKRINLRDSLQIKSFHQKWNEMKLTLLSCSHVIHRQCAMELERNNENQLECKCPECRTIYQRILF